jgi:predicted P-loop ATPase
LLAVNEIKVKQKGEKMTTLIEAKRLYDLGFAILWIHPKSKRPIEMGWTTGERTPWKILQEKYKEGYNVGVRTGGPSKIGSGYLACIDVDIKSPAGKCGVQSVLRNLLSKESVYPEVKSGSGGASRHFYCQTKGHFKMVTIEKNDDFEICVYSDGRQMVLPPSIHPSGRRYEWVKPVKKVSDLPVLELNTVITVEKEKPTVNTVFDFEVKEVELDWLPLSKAVLRGIKSGAGVLNRSDFLLPACQALLSAGLDRDEVLSVMTDPRHYISEAARDRRGKNRKAQAQWVYEYTLKKIEGERDPRLVFERVVSNFEAKKLTGKELEDQTEELRPSWRESLRCSQHGTPIGNVENTVMILENCVGQNLVKRNVFSYRDFYGVDTPWGGKPGDRLGDEEVIKIKYWLGQNFKVEPKNQTIEEALIIIANKNSYDPVRDWLEALPSWDRVPRLDSWLIKNFQAKGDKEYLGQVFSKWILAMVARVYEPGTKFDWMPIFEGPQGIGKSSFGRLLVGDEYFLDWLPNLADKDSALGLQGMWSVEMQELANMRRTQLEDVKSYITRTVDKFRPPYGRRLIDSPRRCVFFGTTNRKTYLVDETGNRRFKPVEVGNLNFNALYKDKEQLFAEAIVQYKREGIHPLTFELTDQAKTFEAKIHQEKMVEDEATVMKEAMEDFVEKVQKGEAAFDFEKFRILDLFSGAGPLKNWKPDNRNCQFATKMLKKLKGEKRKIRGLYYWKVENVVEPCPLDFY